MPTQRLRLGMAYLGGSDEKGQAAGGREEADGDWEHGVEAFYGAEGDDVGGGGEVFGAAVEYIDVRRCNATGGFAQERGFFVVGLDEC